MPICMLYNTNAEKAGTTLKIKFLSEKFDFFNYAEARELAWLKSAVSPFAVRKLTSIPIVIICFWTRLLFS